MIKRFWYFVIRNKYRLCKMCKGNRQIGVAFKEYNARIERSFYSNSEGMVTIKCPACGGSGVIWDDWGN